jgi:hypothetical protein
MHFSRTMIKRFGRPQTTHFPDYNYQKKPPKSRNRTPSFFDDTLDFALANSLAFFQAKNVIL